MSKFDHLGLDGNAFRTFITVLEECSVSKAADRLGVTQSAVSHTLEKLRLTFDDQLFVRSGRGIAPTSKARSLHSPVQAILDNLKSLSNDREFNPLTEGPEFSIAVNDPPLQLIFPPLLQELYAQDIKPKLHFIPSGIPSANFHRTKGCQFLITPAPPEGKELIQHELFKSKMEVFYDSSIRKPPKTRKQFIQSQYAEVQFSQKETSVMASPSLDRSAIASATVTVPNFSLLPDFIKGTGLITVQLGFMKRGILKDLDCSPLPMKTESLPMYLLWHRRDHDDPAHQWFRQKIIDTTNLIFSD